MFDLYVTYNAGKMLFQVYPNKIKEIWLTLCYIKN